MKSSLISFTIIGASMVLASPVQKRQDAVVVTEVVPSTTVVAVTTVLGASGTASAAGPKITADVLDIVPLDGNFNTIKNNEMNFHSPSGNTDINDADGSIVSYSSGASSSVTGPSNPNQIRGGPGNAGSILGSGTNDFGTDVYDYSEYPGGFQQQPGQSANGTYGPDSGPSEDAVSVETATAAAATGISSNAPPVSTSNFFRLVANVTGGEDPYGINGYYVGTYHVSAGSSLAHLTSPSGGTGGSSGGSGGANGSGSGGRGRVFHTNGTQEEVSNRAGTTVTSGGTSPHPESIVLTDGLNSTNVGASNLGNIYINAGEGTKGVSVELNDNGVYVLSGAGDAGYFACFNNNVPYDATHTLKYLMDGEDVPSECTPIVLLPECADTDGNAYTTGELNAAQQNRQECYISVADIDWSTYG